MLKSDVLEEYKKWIASGSIRTLQILNSNEFDSLSSNALQLSEKQLIYFCCFGLVASSTHNTVPERFRINEKNNSIEIWLDRKYVLSASDKMGRQALISLGASSCNIKTAASVYGYLSKEEMKNVAPDSIKPWKENEERYTHILTLSFTKTDKKGDMKLLQAVLSRKVTRAEYDKSVVFPAELKEKMMNYMKNSSLKLYIFSDQTDLHTIGKHQENADRTVFEDPEFTYELGQWLLPNEDPKNVGMHGREFGMDDAFAQKMHKGLLREELLMPDQVAGFATGGKFLMEASSAVCIVTAPDDSIASRIKAGEAYEGLSLLLEEYEFYHSIHAGITEVGWVSNMFASSVLKTKEKPLFVFRIGIPKREDDKKRAISTRPSIEEVILD